MRIGRVLAEALELGVDLDAQLAGGDEDDRLRRQALGRALEDGDAEGGGLAGAGAGLAEDVDAGQRAGDQQRLDLGRRVELRLGQPAEDGGADAQGGEGLGELTFGGLGLVGGCLFGFKAVLGWFGRLRVCRSSFPWGAW